jgi:hypothetical protein
MASASGGRPVVTAVMLASALVVRSKGLRYPKVRNLLDRSGHGFMRSQRVQCGEEAWCPTQPAQPMRHAELLTCKTWGEAQQSSTVFSADQEVSEHAGRMQRAGTHVIARRQGD